MVCTCIGESEMKVLCRQHKQSQGYKEDERLSIARSSFPTYIGTCTDAVNIRYLLYNDLHVPYAAVRQYRMYSHYIYKLVVIISWDICHPGGSIEALV